MSFWIVIGVIVSIGLWLIAVYNVLVGGGTVWGSALAALVFGALRAGATRLQLVGIHPSFAELTPQHVTAAPPTNQPGVFSAFPLLGEPPP